MNCSTIGSHDFRRLNRARPELDVHPETLLVKAPAGGGITRQTIRVTNVGYRLLKSTAKIDPPDTRWLRLDHQTNGRPFQTIDQTDLAVELELPETIDRPLTAAVLIESNGGTRRIGVRVERPAAPVVVVPDDRAGTAGLAFPVLSEHLRRRLGRLAPAARLGVACACLIALRLLAVLANVLPIGAAAGHAVEPRLSRIAIVLAAAGALAGCGLAIKRGDRRDLAAAGFAGAAFGLLGSGVWFALIQSVERLLGFVVDVDLGRRALLGADRRRDCRTHDGLGPVPLQHATGSPNVGQASVRHQNECRAPSPSGSILTHEVISAAPTKGGHSS